MPNSRAAADDSVPSVEVEVEVEVDVSAALEFGAGRFPVTVSLCSLALAAPRGASATRAGCIGRMASTALAGSSQTKRSVSSPLRT